MASTSANSRRRWAPERRSCAWVIRGLITIGVLLPGQSLAQDLEHRGAPIAWQYGVTLSAGEIRGWVFGDHGGPIQGAQVYVEGSRTGTVSGPDGSFVLHGVAPGERRVRFQMIGYRAITEMMIVPSDVGIVVVAVLESQVIGGRCGDLRFRGDGIYVRVLDATTGEPLRKPVTVRLTKHNQSWEQTTDLSQGPPGATMLAALRHRIEEEGEYQIEVEAEGYLPWRKAGVELGIEWAVCDVTAKNRQHTVRLVPIE